MIWRESSAIWKKECSMGVNKANMMSKTQSSTKTQKVNLKQKKKCSFDTALTIEMEEEEE